MKKRYLLIPLILFFLILFIVDFNSEKVINKEIKEETMEIYFPYFNHKKIDDYLLEYINNYIMDYHIYEKDYLFIDYDYTIKEDKYELTFYNYSTIDNKINNSISTFLIDLDYDSISKVLVKQKTYDYDFYNYKEIDMNKPMIAFTFDDGPNYNTSKILDVLNKYNVKATFFVLGKKAMAQEKIIKKMSELGMEIGNHTYNHLILPRYSNDKIKEEITKTNEILKKITGTYPSLFRPSYGSISNKVKNNANMPIIIWNLDTLDWKYHNSKKIANKILNKVSDGDIILMHDIYSATLNAIDLVIPTLLEDGYQIVTVSELFYYKGKKLENNKVYGFATNKH